MIRYNMIFDTWPHDTDNIVIQRFRDNPTTIHHDTANSSVTTNTNNPQVAMLGGGKLV